MAELSLLASAAFTVPGLFPHQENLPQQQGCGGLCRRQAKEFQSLSPGHSASQDTSGFCLPQFKSQGLVDPWIYRNLLSEYDQSSRPVPVTRKPVFIDVQDGHPDSVLFSFGVAEQCIQHEKFLQFLMSGLSMPTREGLNISLPSDLKGLHPLAINRWPHLPVVDDFHLYEVGNDTMQPSLICPQMDFYSPMLSLDFIKDLSCSFMINSHSAGQMLIMGTEAEVKDLLSVVLEFHPSRNPTISSKMQMVVPYFRRSGNAARANSRSMDVHTQTVAPVKRPEVSKLKKSTKMKESIKAGKERDLYRKNYFRACESLLSIILDKNRGKVAILSLKKSGPEASHLLTQFSAGIAGTGLAVLFSVMWKIAGGKVPFCATRLLNTGFAFGLVWLSAALNTLRDNIVSMSKISRKINQTEDEMVSKVEASVNQIFLRAVMLMVMAILRFA